MIWPKLAHGLYIVVWRPMNGGSEVIHKFVLEFIGNGEQVC